MLKRANIVEVIPYSDFSLEITLSDHRHLRLDMKKFLASPAYKKLSQIEFFLSVKHDHRLIYWDEAHDMHIDQILYFSHDTKLASEAWIFENKEALASVQ